MGGLHAFAPASQTKSTFCFRMRMQMLEVNGLALIAGNYFSCEREMHSYENAMSLMNKEIAIIFEVVKLGNT